MTWTSEPKFPPPPQITGWWSPSNLPEPQPNSIPGWFAITWLLAEARVDGITAKADLEALLQARSEVLGLSAIGELTDFYQNTLASAGLIGLSPDMVIHVVSQAISQDIQVNPQVASAVKTDATAEDLNIVVGEWVSVIRSLAGGNINIGTPAARLGVTSSARSGSIELSPMAISAFPQMEPLAQEFNLPSLYHIPYWCRYIDLIGKGAGRGGRGGGLILRGDGGGTGDWGATTIERGVHIPWGAFYLEINIANGTAGSPGEAITSDPPVPNATSVVATGFGTVLSVAGANYMQQGQNGSSGGSYEYRGVTYQGGQGGRDNGGHGEAPGAGGAGGNGGLGFIPGSRGGDGAKGRIWSVARQ